MRVFLLFSLFCYSLLAEVITFTKYVPVYKSVEIERYVTKRVPYEECWEEEVPQESGSDTLGAIIGGAAGGILGHQVGRGSGKTAATIGGAVIGTIIGKNLAETTPGYRIVKRCRKRYKDSSERIVEYKNYATVMGRTIIKYSDHPLREIPVHITVEY